MKPEKGFFSILLYAGIAAATGVAIPSAAVAQTCPSSNGEYTNSGGTGCAIPPTSTANRVTATGSGSEILANGVKVSVPYGTAVTAQNGGAVILGVDPVAGPSSLSELYTGSGGLAGLLASGAGSRIETQDLAISLPASGNTVARAEAGGTIVLNGGSIAINSGGGSRSLLATGAGSSITANGVSVQGQTGGGDVTAYSTDGASIDLHDTSLSLTSQGGGVTVVRADQGSHVTLQGGAVNLHSGGGSYGLVASGAGVTLAADGTAVSIDAPHSWAGNLGGGAAMSFSGSTIEATGTGAGVFLVNEGAANTLTLDNTTATVNDGVLLATQGSGVSTVFDAHGSTLRGAITTDTQSTADVTLSSATHWTVTADSNATNFLNDASTIQFLAPTGDPLQAGSYKTLSVVNYGGSGGTLALNTLLGADGSPSDKLVINGGAATGSTGLAVHNTGGAGADTLADGILVVQASNGGTTAADAFALAGEVRAGDHFYGLFRGGANGGSANNWFLRSVFEVPEPEGPSEPGGPSEPPIISPPEPEPPTISPEDPDPPPESLPPGTYPIIGPELATYGVVQPAARQMGLAILGTLHERVGDTLSDPDPDATDPAWGRSAWGRVFGHRIRDHYRTFADSSTSGQLFGLQTGLDIWRHQSSTGHRDAIGAYFAYANSNLDVDGLVTDLEADTYKRTHTGSVNLNAYSGGIYWTHHGPQGWYLDAVIQGTHYDGAAKTQYARLPLTANGFVSSLEAGYPVPLPLGPRFVLEPQAQIIWQRVSFAASDDGIGPVDLNSTSGASGRIGVRGRWTIEGKDGRVWQPYVRGNLWHDWGGRATATYASDPVPLLERASRLEFAAGLTSRLNRRLSVYLQAGYQFAIGGTDGGGRRDDIQGSLGLRYSW